MAEQVLRNSKYDDQKERLWQHTKDMPRGTIITHTTIADVIGFPYRYHAYDTIVEAWKKRLRKERFIEALAAKPFGTGYLLSTAEQQVTENPLHHRKRARRILGKTAEAVAIAPKLELSDNGQRIQSQTLIQLQDELAMMKNNDRMQKCLRSNPDSMPRLAVG